MRVAKVAKRVSGVKRGSRTAKKKEEIREEIEELMSSVKEVGTKTRKKLLSLNATKDEARKILGAFNAGYAPIWRQVK